MARGVASEAAPSWRAAAAVRTVLVRRPGGTRAGGGAGAWRIAAAQARRRRAVADAWSPGGAVAAPRRRIVPGPGWQGGRHRSTVVARPLQSRRGYPEPL